MGFARPHSRPTATGLTRPPDRLYFVPKSKRKKLGPDAHNVRRLLAAAYSVPVPDRLGRTGLTAAYIGDLSRSWTWHRGSAARIRLRILSGGDSGQFLGQLRSTKCRRRPDYGAGTAGCRRLLGWSGCVLTRRPKTRLRLNTDRVDRVVARRRRDFTGVYNTDVLLLCYVEVSAGIRRRTLSGIEIQKRGSDSRSVVDGPAIGKIVVGDEPEGSEITTPSGLHHGVVDVEIDAPAVGSDSVRSSPFLSVEQRRDILLKYRKLTCARRKQIQEKEPERTTPVEDKVAVAGCQLDQVRHPVERVEENVVLSTSTVGVGGCMKRVPDGKLLLEFLSHHPDLKRQRSPWISDKAVMDGRAREGQIGFSFRGYSRASQLGASRLGSQLGSLPLPDADGRSVLSTGIASEFGGQTSRGTGRSQFALPQTHAPLPRRTPQPQLMLPLRDSRPGLLSHRDADYARGEAFCLEGEQLIKPSGKQKTTNVQKGQQISGYYRDALLRKGATLRPIAAGAFSSRLTTIDAPTDVRSMMMHMSSVSDYVATDFGFNPERGRDDVGQSSAAKFVTRADLLTDVAMSAHKHIYVAQNSHMHNRNSRADDGIQNVRKTLYPFMEQEDGRTKGVTSYRGRDRTAVGTTESTGSRDLPIYDKQLWKRQSRQTKRSIRSERKSPIVLPPINVSKVSLTKDNAD